MSNTRARAREIALHLIYEMHFQAFETDESILEQLAEGEADASECELYADPLTKRQTAYILQVVRGVASHQQELDERLTRSLKGWSLRRVTRISRAVLRLALYEMLYMDDVPIGAAINEAVELAKKYDSDEAGKFVNGVLGQLGREMKASSGKTASSTPASPETAPPELASPETAPPELASPETVPPELASPETAPPELASPETAPPELASPETAPPELASPGPGTTAAEAASANG